LKSGLASKTIMSVVLFTPGKTYSNENVCSALM
jgi:hypothetical protein